MITALLLAKSALSLKPIILIPGAMRSRLKFRVERQPYWYCPKFHDDTLAWIRVSHFLPPFYNCFFESMTLDLDNETLHPKTMENVTVIPDDFGGLDGLRGTGESFFGISTFNYYETLVKLFKSEGYEAHKTLLGATYDWRYGAAQPASFFSDLKKMIEEASNSTNQKAIIVAHSLGGYIAQIFLTEKTTRQWREKYIDSVNLIAPSFSGSGMSFIILWLQRFPFFPFFKPDSLKQFIGSLGVLHIHIPNTQVYGNTTVLIGPDGHNYTGSEILPLIEEKQRLTERQLMIAKHNYKYITKLPESPDVKINILYNSGVKTALGLDLNNWDGFDFSPLFTTGDGLVGSAAIEYACRNWKGTKGLKCVDMNSSSIWLTHRNLLTHKDSISILMNWILNKSNAGSADEI